MDTKKKRVMSSQPAKTTPTFLFHPGEPFLGLNGDEMLTVEIFPDTVGHLLSMNALGYQRKQTTTTAKCSDQSEGRIGAEL